MHHLHRSFIRVSGLASIFATLTSCAPSPAAIAATADARGCWPYGYPRPNPTSTPVRARTTSTTTETGMAAVETSTTQPTSSPAPRPTWPVCTPVPSQPTLTPTLVPTLTPWTRPTPRPALDTTTQLLNLSNMPGADNNVAVAVHPTEGWAAVIWSNSPPDDVADSTIFVKVQDPRSRAWRTGVSVSTRPAYGFASHPDIAIDPAGHLHAFWGQQRAAGGKGLYPHYSRSDDAGATWTTPEPLPVPAGSDQGAVYGRIAVDPAGQIHVMFATSPCFDCFSYTHLARPAAAAPTTAWQIDHTVFPGEKQTRAALAFTPLSSGQVRTIAVTGCNRSCGAAQPVVAIRDGAAGAWRTTSIPEANRLMPEQNINWLSAVALTRPAGQPTVCIAWGNYARSGNFSSCSRDAGASWDAAQPIIFTPPAPEYHTVDTGSTPELLYEPTSDKLVAVSLYRQPGSPDAVYPVYSYRRLDDTSWTPALSGPFAEHQPALRLFPRTRRSLALANNGLRVAYNGSGLAWAAWAELEKDENIDIYVGQFNPAALLTEVNR